ncbi:MAG: ParA family protein [Gammaproteobacteria bacterium]|nr:ParA family protein [Gammaproteobacteria bacterium]
MSRVIAVANQKGGVGKTTTSINLAASLGRSGKRVLLIDLDPQGNASMGSGVADHEGHSIYDVLLNGAGVADAAVPLPHGYDLLPGHGDLAGAELELISVARRERRLAEALALVAGRYDFVYIDCPPALNLLTVNALVAADAVMIPMQCEYYALEGLTALLATVRRVREGLNPALGIDGLLRTMFDPRNGLALEVSDQLSRHFGSKLFQTIIPRNVRLAEAPSYGKPVIDYDRFSKGSQAYMALAEEVLARA